MVEHMPDRITVRVEDEMLAQIDALAAELSEAAKGVRLTRSDVARVALERGIADLKSEKKSKR